MKRIFEEENEYYAEQVKSIERGFSVVDMNGDSVGCSICNSNKEVTRIKGLYYCMECLSFRDE